MNHQIMMLAGHSGVAFGHQLTADKRSPEVPPGILEGEFNRDICRRVVEMEPKNRLALNPGVYNIPQRERVELVNSIQWRLRREKPQRQGVLIVVHANASPEPGWSGANGFRVFHSSNASSHSRKLAAMLSALMRRSTRLTEREIMTRNLTVLYRTSCPAVLIECGFMTHLWDAKYLASEEGRDQISTAIHMSILQTDPGFPF
jgi:N-acetylmuramoyl-L-alanine amidase